MEIALHRLGVRTLLVGKVGQAMQDIVEQVRKVHSLINEIASTTGEQSRGIEQVNLAVGQIEQRRLGDGA